jgi:hypothetical protein
VESKTKKFLFNQKKKVKAKRILLEPTALQKGIRAERKKRMKAD